MRSKLRLEGRNAAVTGASSGIGRASAINLAKAGCDVALIARDVDRLNETAEEIRKLGRRAVVITADITDSKAVRTAVETAISELGCIDIFHCNAGIYLRCPVRDLRMDQIRKLMEVDFFGCLNCVYAVLPHMLQRGKGHIVTTCSMDGKKGVPPDAAYVAAKFAMNGFFQVMRQELRGTGVNVSVIYPSRMDTPQIRHVDTPGITPKGDPDMVGRAVVRAVTGNKGEMMVPWFSCKLLVIAEAISYRFSEWLIRVNKLAGTENGEDAINEAK